MEFWQSFSFWLGSRSLLLPNQSKLSPPATLPNIFILYRLRWKLQLSIAGIFRLERLSFERMKFYSDNFH
jgi:hypothetical protein